jgi:hypothetical protein
MVEQKPKQQKFYKMASIKLNEILRFGNLKNVKIRFNLMFRQNWNPIELFKNGDISTMCIPMKLASDSGRNLPPIWY